VNKVVFWRLRVEIPLISFANILIATFLKIYLEGHNIWCQDGRRSPISGGNAENLRFLQLGAFCPNFGDFGRV
jgi:hypothetical protein